MVVPDTNVLIAYFDKLNPSFRVLEKHIIEQKVILSVISVAEFLVKASSIQEELMYQLIGLFGVTYIDDSIMRQAIIYRKQVIQKSKRSHLLDCFIAATAKVHKATLLTFDRRDYPFPDITVREPKEMIHNS